MRSNRIWLLALALAAAVLYCGPSFAQVTISEEFNSTSTSNPWYYFNGACLTASTVAGTGTTGTTAGTPPGCTADNYYTENLVGGYNGVAGSAVTLPDPSGDGALRFTNGCISSGSGCSNGGHSQNGLIISGNTYATDEGLNITFKTVTYRGDSGGNGASCPSGSTSSDNECVSTLTANPTVVSSTCASGYTESGSGSNATCSETETETPTVTYSCPNGDNSSGSGSNMTCTPKHGGTTTSATASDSCSTNGYTYNSSTGECTETLTSSPTDTYSCPTGYTQSGSGSNTSCSETDVVEATAPDQNDGADGMSFFLMDGTESVNFDSGAVGNYGSWGGSLGYSCSNTNTPYNGLVGGYIGLGIDEYGNFLNGKTNTLDVANATVTGDNTASGGGEWANRIGLRGAGNVSWYWLNENYPTYYPSSLTTSQQETAVQDTCETGTLWNFASYASTGTATNTGATSANSGPTLYDYAAIPNGYYVLPGNVQIANEYATGGYSRQEANPITYQLKITTDGLLSLSYSYNGGAWTSVLKNQSISASNGPLPASIRFGFAGSTGGSSNIHEILCFQATPVSQASSSTTVNQQQSSKVQTGSQAYFGYYDPQNWTGDLTANSLINTNGVLTIQSSANWDASCVLTGVASGSTCATTGQAGPTSAQAPTSRVMLTWSGTGGVAFEWASITAAEEADLTTGDSSETADRLNFLRGDMTNEVNTSGTCPAAGSGLPCFRMLDSVLGDIVDSSSTWVGPPSMSAYAAYETPSTWQDKLYPSAVMPENSGPTYQTYATDEATRQNVVYVGADDGFLHGFSAGSWDTTGTVYSSTTNTGEELLAYMPEGVLETIHNSTTTSLDYANPQYGHNFYVDATPGTGDLYYDGAWHTWLVGGLGPGGAEIYALDVTTPTNFSEANASTLVMGDWQGGSSSVSNPGSFTCQNVANCALNLGDTYGTPTIRRLHNGDWGIIFGNGFNSSTGDAGIYIVTINPSNGTQTTYYLSAGKSGDSDGIGYAHPVDMDGDHVVDYVYAGDLLGNVWRFDLTSDDPQNWAVTNYGTGSSAAPLFTTSAGQPITSDVYPVFVSNESGEVQLMLFFGTGEKFPVTATSATTYSTGQQSFYGIWDWNMSGWNANNTSPFVSLSTDPPGTLTPANLQEQLVTYDASSQEPSIEQAYLVCYAGSTDCNTTTLGDQESSTSSNNQYGWYIDFPGTSSGYGAETYEQEIYNPVLVGSDIQFNSILPAIDSPLMCTTDQNEGWSYALNVQNGTPSSGFWGTSATLNNGNTTTLNGTTIAIQLNASGSSSVVTAQGTSTSGGSGSSSSTTFTNTDLIFQSMNGGPGAPQQVTPGANVTGYRESWIQLR